MGTPLGVEASNEEDGDDEDSDEQDGAEDSAQISGVAPRPREKPIQKSETKLHLLHRPLLL